MRAISYWQDEKDRLQEQIREIQKLSGGFKNSASGKALGN
jgi:hypothetical protein